MKKIRFLTLLVITCAGFTFVSCDSQKSVNLKSDLDSVSYVIGAFQGYQLRMGVQQDPDPAINMDALITGFINSAKGDSVYLGMELQEAQMFLNSYFQEFQNRLNEKNKAEADQFLAENRGKRGVSTTESGLQYSVITEGTGPKPKEDDKVKVDYHGTFLNGTVFDSSRERGEPAEIQLDMLVGFEGFKEGVLMMPVGSKYTLWIPVELGLGGNNPQLYQLIIMEVELLEIIK